MFAPKKFEDAWILHESNLVENLSKKKWNKPLLFFLTAIFSYFVHDLWTQNTFPQWSRFYLVQDKLWASYALIFLSFVPLFIPKFRSSAIFLLCAVSASWLYPIYKLGLISANSILPIFYLLVCALICRLQKLNSWIKFSIVVLLFLGLVSTMTKNAIAAGNGKLLLYFSNIHLDLILLYFVGVIFSQKSWPIAFHFNPLQLLAPNPLPETSQVASSPDYEKQFTKGILNILVAQIIFVLIIFALTTESIAQTTNPLVYYILFVATVIGAMKMASALLWIYGFKTISATYFLVLAKSPIEIWQRGAVFIADFLFNQVYLPLWKRFRSSAVASAALVVAVLVHVFMFRELLVKSLLRWQFGEFFGSFGKAEAVQWGLWVLVWLAWIGIFSFITKLTKSFHKYPGFQWLLIVLTHLGSALIFPIVFYLARIV